MKKHSILVRLLSLLVSFTLVFGSASAVMAAPEQDDEMIVFEEGQESDDVLSDAAAASDDLDAETELSAYAAGTTKTSQTLFLNTGDSTVLSVDVTSNDPDGIAYEWKEFYYSTKEGCTDYYAVSDEKDFAVNDINANKRYRCTVSDHHGNKVSVDFDIFLEDQITEIRLGEEYAVDIDAIGDRKLYTYTPEDDGEFILEVNSEWAYYSLLDEEMNPIIRYQVFWSSYTANMDLTAGEKYYVLMGIDDDSADTYNMKLTLNERYGIDLSDVSAKITLPATSYVYNGKVRKPATTVTAVIDGETVTLTKNTDYTVSYSNNTNAGTATVTVTGKGAYTGTVRTKFKITKAAQSISASIAKADVIIGKTTAITVTGAEGKVTYASADESVATVNSKGTVRGRGVGSTKITVTAAATENYKKATRTVTVKPVLNKTSSLTATCVASGIKLKWAQVTGAEGYQVWCGSTKLTTIKSGSTVTYTDKTANVNGKKYVYKIIAYAKKNNKTYLSPYTKSVKAYFLTKPAITKAVITSDDKQALTWTSNSKADGYEFYTNDYESERYNEYVRIRITDVGNKTTYKSKSAGSVIKVRSYITVNDIKYYSPWSAGVAFGGSCGNNLTWTWTPENKGTITVSGKGKLEVAGYTAESAVPTDPWWCEVNTFVIQDGITLLNFMAFHGNMPKIIEIPKSVTTLGAYYPQFSTTPNDGCIPLIAPIAKNNGTTIRCYKGSAAETFAKKYGLKYELI